MFARTVARWVIWAAFAASSACGSRDSPPLSLPKFDAQYSIALDGEVTGGRSIVASAEQAKGEILNQLFYSVGHFNGYGAGPDMQRVEIDVQRVTPRSDGRFDAIYRARFLVAWPRERRMPASFTLIVPEGGDKKSRLAFLSAYGGAESKCFEAGDHTNDLENFWYYYRPMSAGCSLKRASSNDLAERLTLHLRVSGANTRNKYPEYGKVWEDRRLVVTAVFGKYQDDGAEDDPGVLAVRELYARLWNTFGPPIQSTLPAGAQPGQDFPSSRHRFQTPAGELAVRLELIGDVGVVNDAFKQRYAKAIADSDLVSYSGHSALGENVRTLVHWGHFTPGQYRIFLINSCDSFVYVDDTLRDAHQAANPGSGPHKYFDLISNAMPSFFYYNAMSNMRVIQALVEQRRTYRQILAGFDISQRPVVTGEEDNNWPAPF